MKPSEEGNSVDDQEDVAIDEAAGPSAVEPGEDPPREKGAAGDILEELKSEVARWQDLALRAQADLDNYRKRMAREKADGLRYANARLLESLLPILDNFALGLEAARGEEGSTIYEGMAMVRKQIDDFLAEQGVEPVDTAGAAFDPNLHEAIAQEFSDSVPEGQVVSELRKGYKLKDRLLRASRITVSKGPAPAGEDKEGGEAGA